MSKPKVKYHVTHGNGFTDTFFEWEEKEAENLYEFWKKYPEKVGENLVSLYKDGKLVKRVSFKIEVIEEKF